MNMETKSALQAIQTSKAAEERDRFILFLRGKIEKLNSKETEMYNRIDEANNLIRSWGITKAREMVQRKYGISSRTAYRVINDSIHVFGSIHKAEKNYFRTLAVDKIIRALGSIEESIIKINAKGKPTPIISDNSGLVANYTALLGELRRTVGYDKEDDMELPDWEKIGANPIFMTMDPEEAGLEIVKNPEALKEALMKELFNRTGTTDVSFTEE